MKHGMSFQFNVHNRLMYPQFSRFMIRTVSWVCSEEDNLLLIADFIFDDQESIVWPASSFVWCRRIHRLTSFTFHAGSSSIDCHSARQRSHHPPPYGLRWNNMVSWGGHLPFSEAMISSPSSIRTQVEYWPKIMTGAITNLSVTV